MGYFKQKEIENQVEIPDRTRRLRRSTYQKPTNTVVTDVRTMLILLGASSFFSITTIVLIFVIAWMA